MSEASGSVDWDVMAASFDEEPDHGLRAPEVRAAWDARLRGWLPIRPADVLDLGCGTGSLALLAAGQGHRVTAVDSSPAMVELARAKLAGWDATVVRGDAAEPPVGEGSVDVVLVRHVLWALPEPGKVLRRWRELLRPGGRFVLVEGVWGTVAPAGIPAGRLAALLEPVVRDVRVESLSGDPLLWGKAVDDERYVVVGAV
ncbi:class I SAM-dependent methyltransferase [Streptomyces sp. NPDC026659]|uniref:class I SAM-dependent methyltransferase n=1 Tax=Streptomyces sp. NPDC026659 TaxID=3155123 RepID=UPI0033C8057B